MHRNWIRAAAVVSFATSLTAQARPFGEGCESHLAELPRVTLSAPPVVGTTFDLEIDTVTPGSPFLLVFGTSNTTWSGLNLPFDVAILGFPGCFLNVSYDRVFALVSSSSTGVLPIPVDATGLPAGARIYTQVVVPEPNGSRIAVSQGYEVTLQKSVKDFTFVAVPDTQTYVNYLPWAQIFASMMQWVVDNIVAENIVFVSHVGDIVANGAIGTNQNKFEWDNAEAAIVKLDGDLTARPDGVVPYSMSVGNRDYDIIHTKISAQQYTNYFGTSRYSGRSWFGGAGPDGLNRCQVLDIDGSKYLHISLEWRARDIAITWARNLLTANPELPVILTTHQYLTYGGSGYDDSGGTPDTGGDNGALGIRHKLVEPFPQVFMVLCGHNPGGRSLVETTILGQSVHAMLMDYSFDPNGGNGWMNRIICRPDKAEFESDCFSTYYVPGTTAGPDRNSLPANNGVFSFDFHAHRRMLEATAVAHFTGGHDYGTGTYTGAADTFISKTQPATAFGSGADVNAVHPSATVEQQGLLRFGGIFGTAAGQVPVTRRIVRAILTLTTEGPDATSIASSDLYRLRVPFDETSTWSSLGGGIVVGSDTEATPDASTGAAVSTAGTRSFDVTTSLRAWQKGAVNHGWAVINNGTDNWSFRSQDWSVAAERPMLTVVYEK